MGVKIINVGTTAQDENAAPEFVSVYIPQDGVGVSVLNTSGDVLSYWTSPTDSAAVGTLTGGQSASFTVGPLYLSSASVTAVTLTGNGY